MKRFLTRSVVLVVLVAAALVIPAPARADIAGYGMSALSVGVRYQLNSPGFLPTGDPAEGNVMELDVPIARTSVSGGPVINAIASPVYPGDTAAHLGTALSTFGVPIPIPNYPIVAEANYPPTPDKGASESFGAAGLGEGTAETSEQGANVIARTVSQAIEGAVEIGASTARNELSITDSAVKSTAVSATSAINIAGVISIEGVIGRVEAISDGTTAKPAATLEIGKVTIAGQAGYIDRDGVHVAPSPVLGEGVVAGIQQMVNGVLETDGIRVRTIAPSTRIAGAAANADAGALAITIDRKIPAFGVPGVPALEIPGAPPIILGTPDLPVHIEILIGEARAGANATALSLGGLDVPLAPIDSGVDGGIESSDAFSTVLGAGSSLEGALTSPPLSEVGQAELGLQPLVESALGRGIPFGFVLLAFFGALVASGSLLGYARWQLLEGRQR